MPPQKTFDLKSVGRLFSDTLAAIRNEPITTEALKPEAIEWLKGARYKLMRDVEKSYYKLEGSRNRPLARPTWVNPQKPLFLFTDSVPTVLEPYRPAFKHNLWELLHSCGFSVPSPAGGTGVGESIYLHIHFPPRLTAPPRHSAAPDTPPSQLHVEDEFSMLASGGKSVGTFTAGDFGQLLVDTCADVAVRTSESGAEGDTNPAAKEEAEDDEVLQSVI